MVRTVSLVALCSVIGLAAVGCGGDKDKAKIYVPPGKGGKDAGEVEEKDAGPKKDAGTSEGPDLSFSMLDAASDPNEDTIVTSPLVTVHCIAKQHKAKVDESSVAIKLEKFDADSKEEVQPPTTKVGEDEYQAKFDVSARPNGVLKFTCTAKDVASPANTSALTMQTLLDLGPKIELIEPKDEGIYALRTPVVVKFKVTAQPVTDGDKEADVKDVKLMISGMEQPISESDDSPGTYQTTVDFNDKTLFMVPPTSAEVLVTASDGRTPDAPTRSVKADVKIDGDGPTIKIDAPMTGQIVHGEVVLKLTIQDVSGVKPGSVFATINADALKITDWDVMGTSYQHTFDTRTFGYEITQLTINVSATDVVGNQTDPAASITVKLDNRPPVLSLDPPKMREFRKVPPNYYCSQLFDPVGDWAVNDNSIATSSSYYRVFVEDRTNHSAGANYDYFAGVDKGKVVLYAQTDPTLPLLIDTNGDGECDEIDYADLPENKRPTLVNLKPLEPRGSAFYPKMISDLGSPPTAPGFCMADPNSSNVFPETLCKLGTEMFRVIPSALEDKPPAIYAFMPTNGGTGECEGTSWNVLVIVKQEGWRCLAARAEDTIGNVGVSAPLHVCFTNDLKNPNPVCNTVPPEWCTKSCTISSNQKFPEGMVWEVR
jgi:hypothetical protein